jgi:RHS repeat-associated protein
VTLSSGGQQTAVERYYAIGRAPIAMRNADGTYYLLTDHLGSVVSVLDGSGAQVYEQRYKPFGQPRLSTSGSPTDRGFTGQRELAQAGFADFNARWFDMSLGGFASPDSLIPDPFNPQSLNRYGYVLNNPLRYIDPTGHRECDEQWGCEGRPSRTTIKPPSKMPGIISHQVALQTEAPNTARQRIDAWNEAYYSLPAPPTEEEFIAMTAWVEFGDILVEYPEARPIALEAVTNRYVWLCGLNGCTDREFVQFLLNVEGWRRDNMDMILSGRWQPLTSDVPLSDMTSDVIPYDRPMNWANPFRDSLEYAQLQEMFPGSEEKPFYLGPEGVVWFAFRRPRRGDRLELGNPVWFVVVSQAQSWAFCSQSGGDDTCMH